MTTKIDNFAVEVSALLADYDMQVKVAVAQAVKKTGKKALKTVRAKSPVRKGKSGGRYKKGWKAENKLGGLFMDQASVKIYNATDGPLIHLLENGHQKVNGGRVEGIPHVRTAYEEAERLLPELTARAIEEAGEQ